MLQMNMKVNVLKKFLQFEKVIRFQIPEVTNIYAASDLQKPTRSFSLGINFLSKIISST